MKLYKHIFLYIFIILTVIFSFTGISSAQAIIRWVQYISGSIYVGLIFFFLCVLPKGSLQSASIEKVYREIFNTAFIFLILSILLSLPLQAVVQANLSWSEAWNASIFKVLITGTPFGQAWIVQVSVLVLLLFLLLLLRSRPFVKKDDFLLWISFILGICLLAAKAAAGHAYTAANRHLAITMDTLHLLAASIWIGSLIAIVILLPLRKKEEGKLFFRGMIHLFFPWGVLTVLVLAATGIYSSLLYVPTVNSLFSTTYGKVLLGKVILFFIMLIFALLNSIKGRRDSQDGWMSSLLGEVITGLGILVLTVILTNLPTAW